MTTLRRITAIAVLAAAILVGAGTPAYAQATPIANGHGAVPGTSGGSLSLTFSLVQLPGGSLAGQGVISNSAEGGWAHFQLTSVMTIGDTLLAAGPITMASNLPPQVFVGDTVFFAVNDNGNGNGKPVMDEFANGVAPPNLTIQQIFAIIGPPPPQALRSLESGNFKIH